MSGKIVKALKFFVICTFAICSSATWAQSTPTTKTSTGTSTQKKQNSNFNSGSQGSSSGASVAQAAQLAASGINVVVGGIFATECSSTNKMACAYAALSFANAASMMGDAAASKETAGAASFGGGFDLPDLGQGTEWDLGEDTKVSTAAELSAAIDAGAGRLAEKGYAMKDGKLQTPFGEIDPNDINDPSAMAAHGFSPSDIATAEAAAVTLNAKLADKFDLSKLKQPNVVSMGIANSGGSSSASESSAYSSSISDYLSRLRGPASATDRQKMIAGKSRTLGGEPIGVKVDNLFDMVHRRYQSKRKANQFIEPITKPK